MFHPIAYQQNVKNYVLRWSNTWKGCGISPMDSGLQRMVRDVLNEKTKITTAQIEVLAESREGARPRLVRGLSALCNDLDCSRRIVFVAFQSWIQLPA